MSDLISKLSELRSTYNCFDENERDAYHTLSEAIKVLSAQTEQHGRVFKGIVVEYPTYSTYPEYEGKPYFSIKYTENGQKFIGYGTFKPEVLSEYLKEYFMPSAQPSFPRRHENDSISRAEAIDEVINLWADKPFGNPALVEIKDCIEALPSVDAVEVVRCKDCKHSEHWYRDKSRCFLWHEEGIDVFEDGFCNYAERRTDEKNT